MYFLLFVQHIDDVIMGGARCCALIGTSKLTDLITMAGLLRRLLLCNVNGTQLLGARTICSSTAAQAKVAVVGSFMMTEVYTPVN